MGLTTGQVARITGACDSTVKMWCDRGMLASFRMPTSTHRRILKANLIEFAKDHGIPLDWSKAARKRRES